MKKLFIIVLLLPLVVQAQQRDTCYAGLYLKNMTDLKPDDESWTADFWIWFNYRRAGFDPLKNVEIVNAKSNTFDTPYYAKADRKMRLANETGKAILIHNWSLRNYPFDRQTLRIELEAGLDTNEMILRPEADAFKLYPGINLPGWRIRQKKTDARLVKYEADFGELKLHGHSTFSQIIYQIELQRESWGLFFKLFIGLYVSFFVAFLVFFVSPLRDQRFGLCVGGLFAAIGNKYVMDNNIPSSTTFSFVDEIHDITFVFILAALLLSVISLSIAERTNLSKAEQFDRRSAAVIFGSYLVCNIILIVIAINS